MFSENVFLNSKTAERFFCEYAKNLPIIDFHCHLSPREIAEDLPFNSIAELWLSFDHYKWRLMRSIGIGEEFITGKGRDKEKFIAYANAISLSPGNPLYHWSHMELKAFFNIETPLSPDTAEEIWQKANEIILKEKLSPKKLISMMNVEVIATTDDSADNLEYHKSIAKDLFFKTKVLPAFRTDNLLLINKSDYINYLKRLSLASDIAIDSFDSFLNAVTKRLDYFCGLGCRLSDVGIEFFPLRGNKDDAEKAFTNVLEGKEVNSEEFLKYLGYMFVFLAKEYKKRNITMQLHFGALRNVNEDLFNKCGADSGGDIAGEAVNSKLLSSLLNEMEKNNGLPSTIIYTLAPNSNYALLTAAGGFRNVRAGAAWWHMDHLEGIKTLIKDYAALTAIGTFPGMVTDSRSFLSYPRHDYFRRILCSVLAKWADKGQCSEDTAKKVIEALCYKNAANLFNKEAKL